MEAKFQKGSALKLVSRMNKTQILPQHGMSHFLKITCGFFQGAPQTK